MRRPQLLPGADLVETKQILHQCRTAGLDIRGRASRPDQLLADYLSWCRSSSDQLWRVLHPRDIDRLLLTATYWTLLNAQSAGDIVRAAVHAEIDARTRDLEAVVVNLDQERARWTHGFGPLVVLDTCVFIEHKDEFPASLASIEHRIRPDVPDALFATGTPVQFVIPLQVIDELDKAKADRSRGRAQLALARLNELITAPSEPTKVGCLRDGSHLHLLLDEPGHQRLSTEDDEIVDRAVYLEGVVGPGSVGIATLDTGMHLRTRFAGLRSYLLAADRREESTKGKRERGTPTPTSTKHAGDS